MTGSSVKCLYFINEAIEIKGWEEHFMHAKSEFMKCWNYIYLSLVMWCCHLFAVRVTNIKIICQHQCMICALVHFSDSFTSNNSPCFKFPREDRFDCKLKNFYQDWIVRKCTIYYLYTYICRSDISLVKHSFFLHATVCVISTNCLLSNYMGGGVKEEY